MSERDLTDPRTREKARAVMLPHLNIDAALDALAEAGITLLEGAREEKTGPTDRFACDSRRVVGPWRPVDATREDDQ